MRIPGFAILWAVAACANAAGTTFEPIDLNRPGALERVERERPDHYRAIAEVLRVAERVPCDNREVRSLKARFDIRDMACTFIVLTSLPPKRRIRFELEGTSYVALVTLKDTSGSLVPAKRGSTYPLPNR